MTISVADLLKLCREMNKHTLRDTEKLTGLSNCYLSQIENKKIKSISGDTILKICIAYNISPDTFFRLTSTDYKKL